MRGALVVAAWLVPVLAAAQEPDLGPPLGEDEATEQVGADAGAGAGEPEAVPESDEPAAVPESIPQVWDLSRVMIVSDRGTPRRLEYQLRELMAQVGDVVSAGEYEREARARGLPATSDAAFEALLPGRDLALVLAVSADSRRRARHLRIVYREGRFGMALLTEEHPVSGDELSEEIAARVVSEARLALAAITRPRTPDGAGGGGALAMPELIPDEADRPRSAPRTPGTAVHIGLAAGAGFGMRSFDVPTAPGIVRLSTAPFPSAQLRLVVDVEPEAQGRLSLGGELRYLTSVGLRSTDTRTDGSTRNTSSRSQRLDAELHGRIRLGDSLDAVSIGAGLGWGMRSFSSEAPVTLPDYTLAGPRLRGFVVLPLGDRLRIEVGPELVWIVAVDDSLTARGVASTAFAVGAEGRIRVALFGAFHAEAAYRESHAFLTATAGDSGDIERWATFALIYRP